MDIVHMPQLGETVTEGTVTRWLKQPGDTVAIDDVLFEVSTDKVDTEVPSAVAGVLAAIYVPEGATVAIGTELAAIAANAEEAAEPRVPTRSADDRAREHPNPEGASAGPAARRVRTTEATPPVIDEHQAAHEGFLTPVVRSLLAEHQIEPSTVTGSGRNGRVTRADVLAAAARHARGSAPHASPMVPPATITRRPEAALPQPGPDDDVVEFTSARRATAEHMVRSLATSAHTLVTTDVDFGAIDDVRRSAGLSFLAFVARAVVDELRRFPHLNASVGDDRLIVHRRIHLGVAVDVDQRALVVPVVRDADGLRLGPLAAAVAELADRARRKRLTADDLAGGTFSITNVGFYGTLVTAPIINQPQVAILSTDGIKMRPVAVRESGGSWGLAIHPVGNLSLSFDHRAVDGAYASAFLAGVRTVLESRDWRSEL